MPGGKKPWRIVVAAVVTIGLTAIFLITGSNSSRSQRLPDGSVAFVRWIAQDKTYTIPIVANKWESLACYYLPENIARRLGVQVSTETNKGPGSILIRMFSTNTHKYHVANEKLPDGAVLSPELVIQDDAGDEFNLNANSLASSYNYCEWTFPIPPVSKLVTRYQLLFYYYDADLKTNVSARFTLKNSHSGTAAKWPILPLPQIGTNGDLTLVLTGLDALKSKSTSYSQGEAIPEFETQAQVKILEQGKPSTDWLVAGVTVSDEDGNSVSNVRNQLWVEIGANYEFPGILSAGETRKFRFTLVRTRDNSIRDIDILAAPSPQKQR